METVVVPAESAPIEGVSIEKVAATLQQQLPRQIGRQIEKQAAKQLEHVEKLRVKGRVKVEGEKGKDSVPVFFHAPEAGAPRPLRPPRHLRGRSGEAGLQPRRPRGPGGDAASAPSASSAKS